MNELYHDAFVEEKEQVVYGKDITTNNCTLSFSELSDVPNPKTNNVSFMKIEEIDPQCRNVLAASEKYICYSVTAKRNLLRVIDTFSGEKGLLRGHESSVLDVKISPVDASVLCSVDKGTNPAVPHTIVWKKASDNSSDFLPTLKLPISATLVQPHPLSSNVWAISNNTSIGIFSTVKEGGDSIPISYDTLSAHVNMEPNVIVTEMVFSADGSTLICALQSTVSNKRFLQVYQLGKAPSGKLTLNPLYTQFHLLPAIEGLLTVNAIGGYAVTIADIQSFAFGSATAKSNEEMLLYQVKVWSVNNAAEPPKAIQTITLELPKSAQQSTNANLLSLPYLEVCCKAETKGGKHHLLISSRKSSYVICLAVTPVLSESVVPIFHVTYMNLTSPVLTMDITSILGREHHSSEEGEHLGIGCYQERDQASIQQYHILINTLYDYSKYRKATASPSPAASLSHSNSAVNVTTTTATNVSSLLTKSRSVDYSDLLATTAAASTPTAAGSAVADNVGFLPVISSATGTPSSLSGGPSNMAPIAAPSPVHSLGSTTSGSSESRTILNMLKSMNNAATASSSSPVTTLGSDALNTPGRSSNLIVETSNSNTSQLDLAKKVITPSMFQKKTIAPVENEEPVGTTTTMTVDKSVLTSLQQQSASAAPASVPEVPAATTTTLPAVKKLDAKILFGNKVKDNDTVVASDASLAPVSTSGPPATPVTNGSPVPDLNDVLNRKPATNNSLLNLLKAGKTTSAVPTPSATLLGNKVEDKNTVATSSVAPVPPVSTNPVPSGPPATPITNGSPVPDLNDVLNRKPATNNSLLNLLKAGKTATAPPVVPAVVPPSATPAVVAPVSTPVSVPAPTQEQQPPAVVIPIVLEESVPATSPSPKSLPVSLGFEMASSSSSSGEVNGQLVTTIAQLQSQLALVLQAQERMEKQQQHQAAITNRLLQASQSHANNSAAAVAAVTAAATSPTRGVNHHTEQILVASMDSFKQEVVAALKNVNTTNQLISVQTGLTTNMHLESKKISEQVTKAKQELTIQLVEYMQTKLVPQVTSKVKESLKESMKDTLKTTLADAFRTSFESSLLPAFQVGTDRLFAQMNVAFEQGLSKLEQDAQLVQQANVQSYLELENEVREMKERIKSLEETIATLTLVIQNGVVPVNGGEGNETDLVVEAIEKKPTPMELLHQGLIADAVRSALELKDISETVTILQQLTPQQINSNCSNLIRLCITQQLAADMSVNIPMEGIAKRMEWIKYLVMSLVRISDAEMERDLALSRNFKTMISAVLESIQAGKALIVNAQFDDGEENAIEIPHSVETDLQLLECVIQSKM